MEKDQAIKFMYDLLRLMAQKKGSDLFITASFPPAIKVDGKITPQSNQSLTPQHTAELARAIMNDKQAAEFESTKECNFAISPAGIGRFRVNAFVQQARIGVVLRTIATTIPTFESLQLPTVLKDISMTKRGLVILVGGTGTGKSTSLAAMVDYRNENSYGHIITVEDPIEYVRAQEMHRHAAEVGIDTDSGRRLRTRTSGAGRHPDGRDPRPRYHGLCDRFRRDRPPVHGDAARQQLQPGARPHRQLLSPGAPSSAADGPFPQHARAGFAAPDPEEGRQGARRGGRNPAQLAADCRPHLQGQRAGDQVDHGEIPRTRHADFRPAPVRSPQAGRSATRMRCATPT